MSKNDDASLSERENRIFFKGNPWPEGHAISDFNWFLIQRDGKYFLIMELQTEDYYETRQIVASNVTEESDDAIDDHALSNWESSIVWDNFHSCRIDGGFALCSADEDPISHLVSQQIVVDDIKGTDWDWPDLHFETYLLGHDAVACHRIGISQGPDGRFRIEWTGKFALMYLSADDAFRFPFSCVLTGVPHPEIRPWDNQHWPSD